MNTTPQKNYFRRLALLLIGGTLFIVAFLLISAYAANLRNSVSPLAAYAPYDPVTYGIPYEIAGYKIVAVKTSENTACIPSGMLRLVVQSPQSDVQSFLANSGNTSVIRETLQQLPSLAQGSFDLEFIWPPVWNPEQFMSANARRNELMKNGCITLGPPIMITLTPTSDPFAPYDPATFGIPEIVAGYRILAVTSPENSACMPANTQDVLIQAIDPMPENPMVARGNGDVIFELKKLNPDVQWGLSYIMPVPFDRAQFVSIHDNWNRAMENGCFQFGGPIIIITDTPDVWP